jgi:hypothetical protein
MYTGYHGYWPSQPRKIAAAFGGEEALDALVADAHRRSMRVLFDVVPNHVHEQHPYVAQHPEWFVPGTFASYLPDVEWQNNDAARAFVDDVAWFIDRTDLFIYAEEKTRWVVRLGLFLSFGYIGMILAIRSNKEDFALLIPYIRFRSQNKPENMIVLDTSVIIDGRIADLIEGRFVEGIIVVPKFVLHELQFAAVDDRRDEQAVAAIALPVRDVDRTCEVEEVELVDAALDEPVDRRLRPGLPGERDLALRPDEAAPQPAGPRRAQLDIFGGKVDLRGEVRRERAAPGQGRLAALLLDLGPFAAKGHWHELAVRLQEVFGVAETPTVNNGKMKLVMHLLSPGYKPVQVTSDLHSFWNNLYFEIKKELQRRYPKHSWPDDPWSAKAVAKGRSHK